LSEYEYNPLPLFYDAEGARPVPFRYVDGMIVYEPMKFNSLDDGESAESSFYLKNASMGVVEDLEVKVEQVDGEGVSVALTSVPVIERLAVQEVYWGKLRWEAEKGARAGPRLARVSVELMLTKE